MIRICPACMVFVMVCSTAQAALEFSESEIAQKEYSFIYPADMDHDNDTDFITLRSDNLELTWWENQGEKKFLKRVVDPNIVLLGKPEIFDYDQDGSLDIAGFDWNQRRIFIWKNDGAGIFTKQPLVELDAGNPVLMFFDFMADDRPDGLVLDQANGKAMKIISNTKQENKIQPLNALLEQDFFCEKIDLDRDGDLDLIFSTSSKGQVYAWLNQKEGTFAKIMIDDNISGIAKIAAADLNGDGKIDIVGCTVNAMRQGELIWWQAQGQKRHIRHALDAEVGELNAIILYDLDHDGDQDIVAPSYYDQTVYWWENMDGSNFQRRLLVNNVKVKILAVVDMNGDGIGDLVASTDNGLFAYFGKKIDDTLLVDSTLASVAAQQGNTSTAEVQEQALRNGSNLDLGKIDLARQSTVLPRFRMRKTFRTNSDELQQMIGSQLLHRHFTYQEERGALIDVYIVNYLENEQTVYYAYVKSSHPITEWHLYDLYSPDRLLDEDRVDNLRWFKFMLYENYKGKYTLLLKLGIWGNYIVSINLK